MRIRWSIYAQQDRDAIFDYIEEHNPKAAVATDNKIWDQVQRLKSFPKSGRIGRIEGTREVVVTGTPYVVAYRIADEEVHILAVIHGAMEWPIALMVSE